METPSVIEKKTFKTIAATVAAGTLALSLAGCNEQYKDGEATVVQHVYDDADAGYRSSDPEHYLLYLQQCGYKPHEEDGVNEEGCKVFPYEVSESLYDNVEDGATVRFRTATDGHVIFEVVR